MADDLPFKAEYAKSNRSSCKSCKDNISKDSLRLAKMVQVRRILKNILCDLDEIERSRSQKCEIYMSTRVHSIWVASSYWKGFVNKLFPLCFSVPTLWWQGEKFSFSKAVAYKNFSVMSVGERNYIIIVETKRFLRIRFLGVGGSYDSAEIGETNSDFKGVRLNFMQIPSIFWEAKYDFISFVFIAHWCISSALRN